MATIHQMTQHTVEQLIINASGKIGLGGTVTAVGSGGAGMIAQQVATSPQAAEAVIHWSTVFGAAGFLLALAGFVTQRHYMRLRDDREKRAESERTELHDLQKAILEKQLGITYSPGGIKK